MPLLNRPNKDTEALYAYVTAALGSESCHGSHNTVADIPIARSSELWSPNLTKRSRLLAPVVSLRTRCVYAYICFGTAAGQ